MSNKQMIPAIKDQIAYLKRTTGLIDLNDITRIIKSMGYTYNAKKAKERELERFARNIISSFTDIDGIRTLYATGRSGEFVDMKLCKDINKKNAAIRMIKLQIIGLAKAHKKWKNQIDGQMSLFDKEKTSDHSASTAI